MRKWRWRRCENRDAPELEANGLAFLRRLDGGDERRLAGSAAPALAAGAFAANVRIVDLDAPRQLLVTVALEHDLGELVLDLPGGGLCHPETSTKLDAGDPLLGLGQMIAARNHSRSFNLVEAKIVPAIGEVCTRQALH